MAGQWQVDGRWQSPYVHNSQPKAEQATGRWIVQVSWTGAAIFAAFCLVLWVALANPPWRPLGEAAAGVLILVGFAGIVIPRLRKYRGGL
jgi:glucose-6-phosphate-specific signal transduction histidine kinase